MKTIFITGSSAGIGKATALLFASKGWKVIASMRHPEEETELTGLTNITLLPLDISNPEEIKTAAGKALDTGDIDVVFNNAAYGMGGPLEGIPDDEMVRLFNTNLLGAIRVTQAFIPYFRSKKSGLFITTTALGGVVPFPLCSLYNAAKFALEGWSQSMAFELNTFGIAIKTIAPGLINTGFSTRAYFGNHEAYQEMLNRVMSVMMKETTHSSAEKVAATVYEAATDGKDQLRYLVGDDANAIYEQFQKYGPEATHKVLHQKFFE